MKAFDYNTENKNVPGVNVDVTVSSFVSEGAFDSFSALGLSVSAEISSSRTSSVGFSEMVSTPFAMQYCPTYLYECILPFEDTF